MDNSVDIEVKFVSIDSFLVTSSVFDEKSSASNQSWSSQRGFLIALSVMNEYRNVLCYRSIRSWRIARRLLPAELYELLYTLD